MVCGGRDENYQLKKQVFGLKLPNFEVTEFPSMVTLNNNLNLVTHESDIVAVGNNYKLNKKFDEPVLSMEIYSRKNKTWTHQYVEFGGSEHYCVCSFKSNLYIIGGWLKDNDVYLSDVFTYDITINTCYQKYLI